MLARVLEKSGSWINSMETKPKGIPGLSIVCDELVSASEVSRKPMTTKKFRPAVVFERMLSRYFLGQDDVLFLMTPNLFSFLRLVFGFMTGWGRTLISPFFKSRALMYVPGLGSILHFSLQFSNEMLGNFFSGGRLVFVEYHGRKSATGPGCHWSRFGAAHHPAPQKSKRLHSQFKL